MEETSSAAAVVVVMLMVAIWEAKVDLESPAPVAMDDLASRLILFLAFWARPTAWPEATTNLASLVHSALPAADRPAVLHVQLVDKRPNARTRYKSNDPECAVPCGNAFSTIKKQHGLEFLSFSFPKQNGGFYGLRVFFFLLANSIYKSYWFCMEGRQFFFTIENITQGVFT